MGFEFLLWIIRAWTQKTSCTCGFTCIKDFVIKIDFQSKICPRFLMTWVWLSWSFHLVKLISHLLLILRHAVALVVVVELVRWVGGWELLRCVRMKQKRGIFRENTKQKKVDFWRKYGMEKGDLGRKEEMKKVGFWRKYETKKGEFLEKVWNKKGWVFGENGKKVDFLRRYERKKVDFWRKSCISFEIFSPRWYQPFVDAQWAAARGATNTNCFGEHEWLWPWTLQPFMGAASRAHRNLYPCRETGIFLGDRSNKAQGGKWACSAAICSILWSARQECREVPSSLSQRQVMTFLGFFGGLVVVFYGFVVYFSLNLT